MIFALIAQYPFWAAVVAFWIYSAAVSSMPEPSANSGAGYLWIYRFLHTIAGNLTTAFGSKLPGLPVSAKVLIFALLIPTLLVAPAACSRYVVHPGAVNSFDSITYDSLSVAKTLIDTARTQQAAKTLPAYMVPAFNALAAAYDIAYPAWEDWRVAAGLPGADQKLATLNAAMAVLANAEKQFNKGVK